MAYTERLEQFFIATDVASADKKRALLLSGCGPHTYSILQDIVLPAKPSEKTFDELCQLMQDHQQPPPNPVLERFKFHNRVRKEGKSISDFVAALKRQTKTCGFGDAMEDLLRDRIVCGCNNDRMQKQLLAKTPPPAYKDALAMALAMEAADKDVRDLQGYTTAPAVHYLPQKQRSSIPPQGDCYRCGGKHRSRECRFKDSKCHHCQKIGHLARCCRLKAQQANTKQRTPSDQTNQVQEDSDSAESVYHVDGKSKPPYLVEVTLNDAPLQMELDTGAIISEKTYLELKQALPSTKSTNTRLRTYSGQQCWEHYCTVRAPVGSGRVGTKSLGKRLVITTEAQLEELVDSLHPIYRGNLVTTRPSIRLGAGES